MKGKLIWWLGGILWAVYVIFGWLGPLLVAGMFGWSCWDGLLLALGGHILLAILTGIMVILTRLAIAIEEQGDKRKERSEAND